jgi:hypothetical protein
MRAARDRLGRALSLQRAVDNRKEIDKAALAIHALSSVKDGDGEIFSACFEDDVFWQ